MQRGTNRKWGQQFDFRHYRHISTSGLGSGAHPRRHLLYWRLYDLDVSFSSKIRLPVLETGSSLFAAKRLEMGPYSNPIGLLRLAVWLNGNALASINVVALRQTRLVPGWVTVCGRVNHFGI